MTARAAPAAWAGAAPAAVPRVAFMGEFSAGKSTAVNLVIGARLLPTAAVATQLPPVWIAHGPEPRDYALDAAGRWSPLPGLDLAGPGLRRFAGLRLERPLPRLRGL